MRFPWELLIVVGAVTCFAVLFVLAVKVASG